MKSGRKFLLTDLLYLKVFLAFTLGIICVEYISARWILYSLPFSLFVFFIGLYKLLGIQRSKVWDSFSFSAIFFTGILVHLSAQHLKNSSIQRLSPILDKEGYHIARIEEKPIEKSNSMRLEVTLLVSSLSSVPRLKEKILIYLPKETKISELYYGQMIRFKGRIIKPAKPHYSFEFDYKKWLERKGIYATMYSKDFQVMGYDYNLLYQLKKWPLKLRDYFEGEIDRIIPDIESNAIAKSILIGIRTDIDRELYNAYADTGTIHILSVSGLHFGILIFFIDYLLSFLIRREKYRLLVKHSFSFLYALITGFSAPIMRSFIMFLFLDIARWNKVRTSSFNILALSAWLILLVDSHQLFNIGFQFSYAALLGIMLIYQRGIWKLQFDNFLANFVWKSTITLFAAWLFTTPLTLFYYHKFSWLGSLSNLLVVPITTIIMYVGFLFLVCSKIHFISDILGYILTQLITIQNKIVSFFSSLPCASIEANVLNLFGLILVFMTIGFGIVFMYSKSRISLRIFLLSLFIGVISTSFYTYNLLREEKWFLVSNYKHSSLVYKTKDKILVFSDSIDQNTETFFFTNLSSYYNIPVVNRYGGRDYLSRRKNKYSTNLDARPDYLIVCKENKDFWQEYIDKRDSFVLMSNVGYKKQELIDSLTRKKKRFNVY